MESLKLRFCFDYFSFSNSPTHRFSSRVNSLKNSTSPHNFPKTPLPIQIIQQFKRIQTIPCGDRLFYSQSSPSSEDTNEIDVILDTSISLPSDNQLVRNAAWIGLATLTSKILGLLREIIMAAVFGVGPVAIAFRYAYVLPGFAASLLGGVNGPIHVTMATTLSKLSKERRKKLFQHTNAVMFLMGGALGALVFVSAEFIIHIYAPGLWILPDGRIIREIAIAQLKFMIPCIVLAGPVGLGFGYMSAEQNTALPSISPALSSMLMIALVVMIAFLKRSNSLLLGHEVEL